LACTGFVEDGDERLMAAWEAVVRPQVEAEYAESLSAATLFGRWRLRREMEREIKRRSDPGVSPEALF